MTIPFPEPMPVPTQDASGIFVPSQVEEKIFFKTPGQPELRTLHVFERLLLLRETFDLRDPYWAEIITAPEYIAAAEHYDFDRPSAHRLSDNGESYGSIIRDGALERMLLFLKDYEVEDYEPGKDRHSLDTTNPVIVGELHCPFVNGAQATFEMSETIGSKIGVEVTAAGVGGGGWTTEQLYSSATKFSIAAPFCELLLATLRGYYVIWNPLDPGPKRPPLVLVGVDGIGELQQASMPNDDDHLCWKPDTFSKFLAELESGYSTEKRLMKDVKRPVIRGQVGPRDSSDTWETTRTYEGRWGSDIEVGGAKLGAGVKYSSHFIHTIKVTETLPFGYRYIGKYQSTRNLPQQWAFSVL